MKKVRSMCCADDGDCLRRHDGCHDRCEDYQKFIAYRKAIREKQQSDKCMEDTFYNMNFNSKGKRRRIK